MLPFQLIDEEVGTGIRRYKHLAARDEDMTPPTKIVVVHHVVACLEPSCQDQKQHHANRRPEGQLDHPISRGEPDPNGLAPTPESYQDANSNQGAEHDPADHYPTGSLENPLDDGYERIRQR